MSLPRQHVVPAVVAVAALAVALLAPRLAADPHTDHFTALMADLEDRLENEYGGDLDAEQAKRKKTLEKVLARLDRDHDTIAADLRSASFTDAKLRKAFPAEFEMGAGLTLATGTNLGDHAAFIAGALENDVLDARADLEERLPGLSEKGGARVARMLDLAADAMDDPPAADSRKLFYKGLLKALALVGKGNRLADRDPGAGEGAGTLTMTLDGNAYDGTPELGSEWYPGTSTFQLATNAPVDAGVLYTYLHVPGVTGTGEYSLTADGVNAFLNYVVSVEEYYQFAVNSGGTITITHFDPPARVAGTFAFTATHGSLGTKTVTNGSFDVTGIPTY